MLRKSYRITKAGSLKNLKLIEEELPEPNDNEITVEIKAIGLNFADVFTIQGLYKAAPKSDFIPGLEFSGKIIKAGSKVEGLIIGDDVIGVIKFGSFTTHLNIDYRYVIKLPDDWSYEEGSGFIVQALTAYYAMVVLGEIENNQTVLIHSAAGGVGIYANRIAKKYNAFTIGTIGNPAKIDLLNSESYNEVIVRNGNFKNELKDKLNGRELDLVMEAVGGKYQKISFDLLTATGRLVAYGLSSFAPHGFMPNYFNLAYKFFTRPKFDTLKLIESNKSVLGFNLIWLYERLNLLKGMLTKVEELHLAKPYIGKVFDYEEMHKAIKTFQSGKTMGKVVVKTNL